MPPSPQHSEAGPTHKSKTCEMPLKCMHPAIDGPSLQARVLRNLPARYNNPQNSSLVQGKGIFLYLSIPHGLEKGEGITSKTHICTIMSSLEVHMPSSCGSWYDVVCLDEVEQRSHQKIFACVDKARCTLSTIYFGDDQAMQRPNFISRTNLPAITTSNLSAGSASAIHVLSVPKESSACGKANTAGTQLWTAKNPSHRPS